MATAVANSSGQLFQLFRSGEVRTRSDVQALTGLSRSTLAFRLDGLLRAGYLLQDGVTSEPGRGRPSIRLRVNDFQTTVLVADLGATHGRVAVCTAAGDVLAERVIESEIGSGPRVVLDRVHKVLERLLRQAGRDRTTLRGVGVGVPGPVDHQTGRIARSISMPGWDDYPVADPQT